jgi:hypothetical protein
MANEHAALSADDLKTVRKAVKCPAKLIKSEGEKTFLKETKDRLEKFNERVYLSNKQVEWLRKIASRMDAGDKKPGGGKPRAETAQQADLPSYDDLAGE